MTPALRSQRRRSRRPARPGATAAPTLGHPQVPVPDLGADLVARANRPAAFQPQPLTPLLLGGQYTSAPLRIPLYPQKEGGGRFPATASVLRDGV